MRHVNINIMYYTSKVISSKYIMHNKVYVGVGVMTSKSDVS